MKQKPIKGDVFRHHQIQIARQTLRMTDEAVNILGGMTKEEARRVLRITKKEK